ncbi:hypothetical protein CEXT_771501 [Caerostris extrusa]|uniref:Uncharacterized protein n=1 Tax=Caerostris extrusa TaxID=172846 RepID=A0AAV4RHI2_CAEEX|nr:hypothetical protein CEXT_771501 [Caerostris extrusa]
MHAAIERFSSSLVPMQSLGPTAKDVRTLRNMRAVFRQKSFRIKLSLDQENVFISVQKERDTITVVLLEEVVKIKIINASILKLMCIKIYEMQSPLLWRLPFKVQEKSAQEEGK